MKKSYKILSLVLAISILLGTVPFSVFANENKSTGNESIADEIKVQASAENNSILERLKVQLSRYYEYYYDKYAGLSDEEKAEMEFHDKLANAETEEERDALFDECYQATDTLEADEVYVNSYECFDDGILKYYIRADNESVSIYEPCDKNIEQVSIPSSVSNGGKTYLVTGIGSAAFSGCKSLTSVSIPDNITSIGQDTFKNCTNLTYVYLPSSVTNTDGFGKFKGCVKLKTAGPIGGDYNIQFGWTDKIPDEIFSSSEITQVNIPDTITTIGKHAFYDCTKLEEVHIPDNVAIIESNAFSRCNNMKSVSIGSKVTTIDYGAFADCNGLISVSIPDSVTTIGSSVFSNCIHLQNVSIGRGVTSIGAFAFSHCETLSDLNIPNNVTHIGAGTFKYCTGLVSVIIPDSVIEIDSGSTVRDDSGIFEGCDSLKTAGPIGEDYNIQFGWTDKIPDHTFVESKISQIKLPDTIKSIGNDAFTSCNNLTEIHIPEGVTNIGEWAFEECKNLTQITIPETVTSIKNYTFSGCINMQSVSMGNAIDTIGRSAFSGCKSLKSIVIPVSVTHIGYEAFSYCYDLTSITMSDNMVSIGQYAFAWCKSLTSVTVPESVTTIGLYAFNGCTSLIEINIPEAVTSIGQFTFYGCTSLKTVTIGSGVTDIGVQAFGNCSNLKSVMIPDSVTLIYPNALGFYDDQKIDGFTIYGYNGSAAETYANNNRFEFIDITTLLSPKSDDTWSTATEQSILYNVGKQIDNLSIDIGTVDGPTINILGNETPLFTIDGKLDLPVKDAGYQVSIDTETKTVKASIGLKDYDKAEIIQSDKSDKAEWEKQYKELKSLYKNATRSGFEKMKNSLNRMNCNLLVNANVSCGGYLEFSYATGKLEFSEGGLLAGVSVGAELTAYSKPIPIFYATLGLTADVDGSIKAIRNNEKNLDWKFSIEPALTAKIALGAGAKAISTYVEGGMTATLKAIFSNENDPFKLFINGDLYFEWAVLGFKDENCPYTYEYVNKQLYPPTDNLMCSVNSLSADEISENAQMISRDYLQTLCANNSNGYSFEKDNLYPYNEPSLVNLNNGKKLLVWLDDLGTKSSENRTSLVYSICDNGTWSTYQTIAEDGTSFNQPYVYQNGDNVYVCYQKADTTFDSGTTLNDMLPHYNLYISKFNGTGFDTPICVNDYTNQTFEGNQRIYANDNGVTVVWQENDNNDIFSQSGNNIIKTRTYCNNQWSDVNTVNTSTNGFSSLEADNNGIYYIMTDGNGNYSLYFNNTVLETSTDSISSLSSFDGKIYYLVGNTLKVISNGNCEETGLKDISNYRFVKNGEKTSVLTNVSGGLTSELYISNYSEQGWSDFRVFTNFGKYIRNYSPVMDDNGVVQVAVNVVDVNEDKTTDVYGNASLFVTGDCNYYDLSTDYIYCDAEDIKANTENSFTFNVNNNSNDDLTSFKATLKDSNSNVLSEKNYDCSISAWQSKDFKISYTASENLSKDELTVTIEGNKQEDTSNNSTSVTVGFADLSVNDMQIKQESDGSYKLVGVLKNTGYEKAENSKITVYKNLSQGEVMDTVSIGTCEPNSTQSFEVIIPKAMWNAPSSEAINALCIEVTSDAQENNMSNNTGRVVYDTLFEQIIDKIEITKNPDKTTYVKGEELITTGMTVKATYKDNSTRDLVKGEYLTSEFDSSKLGTQTVTVSYLDKTATFTVTVMNGKCGDNAYWSFDENTGTLNITGSGAMYYEVVEPGKTPWSDISSSITKIEIGDDITSIYGTFTGLENLTTVNIGKSVGNISCDTFYNNPSLTDINVDGNNTTYSSDNGILYNYQKTELITFPTGKGNATILDTVENIKVSAFYKCTLLTAIILPSNVKKIDDTAFYGCTGLTTLNIPDNVTYIGSSAFSGCTALSYVNLSKNLATIKDCAFSACPNLKSVTLLNSSVEIGSMSFGYSKTGGPASGGVIEKVSDFTVRGYNNSTAEIYATQNGFTFVEIGSGGDTEIKIKPGSSYVINNTNGYVSHISEKTSKADFLNNFSNSNIEVYNANGEVLSDSDNVGTGCAVKATSNGNAISTATVVVTGDVDGNGEIDIFDVFGILDHINNKTVLTGAKEKATLVDSEDEASIFDVFAVLDYINGKRTIEPRAV